MRAAWRVQAFIGKDESLNRLPANDVRLDDLIDIGRGDVAVPDLFGINDDRWSVLTLIKATGFVRAHAILETESGQLLFEGKLQLRQAGGIAAAAGILGRTLITADKKMPFELGHGSTLQESSRKTLRGQITKVRHAGASLESADPSGEYPS